MCMTKNNLRLLVAGGGSGGHLYPALSVVRELEKMVPCSVLFAGTRRGLESRIVPGEGYSLATVWISGLHRGRLFRNLLFPLKMAVSLIQAAGVIMRFRPHLVFGTGGYASWPVMTAAWLMGRRTAIQEQNRSPGLVTRLMAPRVDSVHLSFDASKACFKNQKNLHVSGNPTRSDLEGTDRKSACRRLDLDPKKNILFVFGGSQGARAINEAMLPLLERLAERNDVQVLWVPGPRWAESIERRTGQYSGYLRIFPYMNDMASAFAASDLVICRSGATTVAEITRLGLAAVFIPFAGAAGGHQMENARLLASGKAAELVPESELEDPAWQDRVLHLLDSRKEREAMGHRAKRFGRPEAAREIALDLISLSGWFSNLTGEDGGNRKESGERRDDLS
jgi:UDP-N-acetylglucosamine--N-acetylmuramyl-(pentapeptide) pyrophosphoryl-undecaprenol N-acetylglucosamine transferase